MPENGASWCVIMFGTVNTRLTSRLRRPRVLCSVFLGDDTVGHGLSHDSATGNKHGQTPEPVLLQGGYLGLYLL